MDASSAARLGEDFLCCSFVLFFVCSSLSTGMNATFLECKHAPRRTLEAGGKSSDRE
jgi:hypothetical protein